MSSKLSKQLPPLPDLYLSLHRQSLTYLSSANCKTPHWATSPTPLACLAEHGVFYPLYWHWCPDTTPWNSKQGFVTHTDSRALSFHSHSWSVTQLCARAHTQQGQSWWELVQSTDFVKMVVPEEAILPTGPLSSKGLGYTDCVLGINLQYQRTRARRFPST
jgi:hypothetical protein